MKLPIKNELIEIQHPINEFYTVVFFARGERSKKILVHDCKSMFYTTKWRFPGEKEWKDV